MGTKAAGNKVENNHSMRSSANWHQFMLCPLNSIHLCVNNPNQHIFMDVSTWLVGNCTLLVLKFDRDRWYYDMDKICFSIMLTCFIVGPLKTDWHFTGSRADFSFAVKLAQKLFWIRTVFELITSWITRSS